MSKSQLCYTLGSMNCATPFHGCHKVLASFFYLKMAIISHHSTEFHFQPYIFLVSSTTLGTGPVKLSYLSTMISQDTSWTCFKLQSEMNWSKVVYQRQFRSSCKEEQKADIEAVWSIQFWSNQHILLWLLLQWPLETALLLNKNITKQNFIERVNLQKMFVLANLLTPSYFYRFISHRGKIRPSNPSSVLHH